MDDEAAARTRTAFDAASDHFDDPALSYLVHIGRRSVEHAGLRAGDHVLDVACGSGNSLLTAAEIVGPTGRVVGVDLSEGLLELARTKAECAGHAHVELVAADMRGLELAAGSFDIVLSVLGVFFVPDMEVLTRELFALVKPGGRLVVTVWAEGFMEPAYGAFWDAVREERAELVPDSPPWRRVSDPDGLRAMLTSAGIPDPRIDIETVRGLHPLAEPDDFWTIATGTGLRGAIDQLDAPAVERVRAHMLDVIRTTDTTALPIDVHVARATKSAEG